MWNMNEVKETTYETD
jgi:hypothetical protein